MERQKRLRNIAIGILVVFHLVGLIGFHLPVSRVLFQQLVPLNLLLSLAVLGRFHQSWTPTFIGFCILIFLSGWGVEVMGVQGGWLFGEYAYGKALGPKIAQVPIIMGVNWLTLVYITGVISKIFQRQNGSKAQWELLY